MIESMSHSPSEVPLLYTVGAEEENFHCFQTALITFVALLVSLHQPKNIIRSPRNYPQYGFLTHPHLTWCGYRPVALLHMVIAAKGVEDAGTHQYAADYIINYVLICTLKTPLLT